MTEAIVTLAFDAIGFGAEESGELPWQDRALCAQTDPEAFFPEKGGSTREAKRVCRSCEVRAECLEYAASALPSTPGGRQALIAAVARQPGMPAFCPP